MRAIAPSGPSSPRRAARLRTLAGVALAVVAALGASGCLKLRRTVTVFPDGSGTIVLETAVHPMVRLLAEGKEPPALDEAKRIGGVHWDEPETFERAGWTWKRFRGAFPSINAVGNGSLRFAWRTLPDGKGHRLQVLEAGRSDEDERSRPLGPEEQAAFDKVMATLFADLEVDARLVLPAPIDALGEGSPAERVDGDPRAARIAIRGRDVATEAALRAKIDALASKPVDVACGPADAAAIREAWDACRAKLATLEKERGAAPGALAPLSDEELAREVEAFAKRAAERAEAREAERRVAPPAPAKSALLAVPRMPTPVAGARAAAGLDPTLAAFAATLAAEVADAGFSTTGGTLALDTVLGPQRWTSASWLPPGDEVRFVTFARTADDHHGIAVVIDWKPAGRGRTVRVDRWRVVAAKVHRTAPDAAEADVLAALGAGTLPAIVLVEPYPSARERADGDRDPEDDIVAAIVRSLAAEVRPRRLYHAAGFVARHGDESARRAAGEALAARAADLTGIAAVYREPLLELLAKSFPENAALPPVARAAVADAAASKDAAVLGAILLAERGEVSAAIRDLVRRGLGHASYARRAMAVRALGRVREGLVDERLLLAMLADADADVRGAAREVAKGIAVGDDHVAALERVLASPRWEARREGALVLGTGKGGKASVALAKALGDADADVRNVVAAALAERELDASVVPPLAEHAGSARWEVRRAAVVVLARIPAAEASAALIRALADADADVRSAAAAALADRELDETAVEPLAKLGDQARWEVRRAAAVVLARIPGAESSAALVRALADADADVRTAVAAALDERALDATAVEPLAKLGDQARWEVRRAAVVVLARIPGAESSAALVRALADADTDVRTAVAAALAERELDATAVEPLAKLGDQARWEVRRAAVVVLARIPGAESSAALVRALADADADVRTAVAAALAERELDATAVEPLAKLGGHARWEVRRAAVEALGRVPGVEASVALAKALADADADVRGAAAAALDARDLSPDAVVAALGEHLGVARWETRAAAAKALGATGSAKALALLEARLGGETDGDVKGAIQAAIARLGG